MPTIPSFLRPSSKPKHPSPSTPITTYYLSSPSSSPFAPLRPIPPPQGTPHIIPPHNLIFSLTHPPTDTSKPTAFFLQCIPDPIGFLYHSSTFIHRHLNLDDGRGPGGGIEWRHQLIQLVLEDKDGLAATSGGKIGVSLRWIEGIMNQVERGEKGMDGAIKEFKGVLLHELVHTIQHDGHSTCPGWLIESIADHIRLPAHLGPLHWRKSGSGKKDKGWEEGYDIGAKFLEWLTCDQSQEQDEKSLLGSRIPVHHALPTPTPTTTTMTGQAIPTQYPNVSHPSDIPQETNKDKEKMKHRPGPYPDLIKLIDMRLKYEKWDDIWWKELTGMSLEDLWATYLDYYER
ncbi:hypothetical protein I203_106931 [Kwoniella mangroviensis CBS 8507]|uniref:hypothetical protein n=1 Tax=Kwoniella mangroviensis CBS 8507 TaxID=1296122 RepID=UPI00080D5E10|nr:uncharacterized protein I203_08365 [Kwoniella mangroviensis CBS 8507]OCF62564.1 hypothetical protein I203_08365 [Kwoniella mangroviensis CBS 8507]